MFQAVRNWWKNGHGKETSRLFVFELTVVMIGVLAAQQVSNWAQQRSENNTVDALQSNLMHLSQGYYDIARTYERAIPCLDQRVGFIMQAAASRTAVERPLLVAVPLIRVAPDDVSIEEYRALNQRFGARDADLLFTMEFNLKVAETSNNALEDDWAKFERLDPALGQVGQDDRIAVRAAGVEAKGQLRRLLETAKMMESLARDLKLQPGRDAAFAPVESCPAMWRTGQSFAGGL